MKTTDSSVAVSAMRFSNPCGSPQVAAYSFMKYVSVVLLFLMLCVGNAWGASPGSGTHYASATTVAPAQGLVYMSTSNETNVADDKFKNSYPGGLLVGNKDLTGDAAKKANACYTSNGNNGCTPKNMFFWARPSRGYEFNGSWGTRGTNYAKEHASTGINNACTKSSLNEGPFIGTADIIQTTAGGQAATWIRPIAGFKQATKYVITYVVPNGGSYSVHYEYTKSYDTGTTEADGTAIWKFRTETEDYSLTPSLAENKLVDSYAADKITLTVPAETTNFIGWYEGTTQKSTATSYTYPITKAATITALFKTMSLGTAEGDLSPAVEVLGTMSPTPSITIPVTAHGSWAAGDFTVTFTENGSRGDVTKGTVTYAQNSGNVLSSEGTLTIPFTYNPASWGNTEVNVTISPKDGSTYGNSVEFTIKASATQVLDYEACILLDGETEPQSSNTGTLAEMVTLANSMDSKFTLQLAKNVTISSPLSLRKSMKFDLNDKKITSTGASAFSIDAAGVDVQIVDEGFSGLGEIATESAQSGNVCVVTFTQKAKLTMQGGTLSATNTGSGSAYGINVTQGSTFYMTNGQLTVTGVSEAQGVHVATASDYATLNGGSITVTAPSSAYGVWSAGQGNVTGTTISAETTTGANAYGVYVNGGVSTLTTNTITATAATTNAYGAYVNAGRLNGNAGSIAASVATSGVYGVHIHGGATAMLQQNMVITAEAIGASGTKVFGVDNLGTVGLTNVTVTATSPTTAATAVNSATGAISTTIDGGTYRATAEGGTAYGLHHQYGALTVDGGTFRSIGSGNNVYGARAVADGTIANATITGETRGTGNTAYGFVGGVANKNITLTNCAITGQSNTSKAYAIYSRANVTATGCTLTATTLGANYACGFYAENGANSSVNTNATVSSYTIQAYGVYHNAGSMTVNGGEYNVEAKQTTAASAQNSELYGLYNAASQTTNVNGTSFIVNAENQANAQNVYGAYINGTLNSSDATYYVEAKLNVYGVWGNTASTLNLSDNTISSRATNGTTSYGVYAKKNFTIDGDIVNATGTSTGVYAMFFDATNSVGEVRGGKFSAVGNGTTNYGPLNSAGTVGKVQLKGGVYTTNANLSKYAATGYNVYNLDETLSDYAGGYRHTIATENPSPYVCKIVGGNYYTTLEAALQYTKDNDGTYTIVMTQNYTLPAGDYELPAKATLLIPHKEGQQTIYGTGSDNSNKTTTAGVVEEFMRLTLASGANLNVNGKIEASAQMYCVETGHISFINGPYARIYMASGSLIQLNSGAVLYAWGKVSGAGEIKVKNNAEVREMFQIYGMPSMSNIANEYNDNSYKFFPVQQYEISNVEVPTTYYYNSRLVCAMSNYYKGAMVGVGYNKDDNIKVVGTSNALFLVDTNDESAWVRKSYVSGYQVWEANSAAKLGSLTIDMQQASMNSANYILPLTTSMKIHIMDGDFTITQDAQLLPGSQLEINKTGQLTINSGCRLFVFDADQSTFTSKPDAALNIHGKIDVKGGLYTTNKGTETSKTDGANIYSTNADAGTITFSTNAPSATTIKLMTSATATKTVNVESAKLKNGDGTFASTSGTVSGEAWVYMNNAWVKTYTNGCFEVIGSTVYAKPSEYVALKKSQTVGGKLTGVEETNHTYLTAADKILILMDECQWWEVEATDDPAVFECKKEGYEGFYFYNTTKNKWELKTVTVKFYKNETGSTVLKDITTDYNGVPDQAVIATNPTKETTAAATYAFYGWKSSVTGTTYKWTDQLEKATADMSYRPVFTETPRNYTITLNDANNGASVAIEVPYNEMPSYEPKKDATAQYTYTFDHWNPAFVKVTGKATYTAQWNSAINHYNITWKNGETVLETDENQDYGTATAYNGTLPTKEADNEYAYTFSGWKSSLTGPTYANGSTPTVGGETTYEAQYSTTPRYAVTFNNYDGTQLDRTVYTQGETPAYDGTPARKRDADGYFRFIGWKNSAGTDYAPNATLPTVTKKETYTAQYEYVTDLFKITLNNIDGAGSTWSGKFGVGSMPFYDPDNNDVPVVPTKAGNEQYTYVFSSWSPAMIPVDGEATYTAVFSQVENKHSVSIEAGANGSVSPASVSEIGCETASADITATPDAGYAFNGWTLPDGVTAATGYTAASNPIRIHAIAADKTITANFAARNDIKYTVKHWQQNIADDDYTEVTADQETKQGTTGAATAATAKPYTGFTVQPFEQGIIAGNGTTIVNIYYNRNKYIVTWEDGNGETIETDENVKFGVMPSFDGTTPAKDPDAQYSYTFAGWSPEVTSVTADATYTAQFSSTPRTYTITLNTNGGSINAGAVTEYTYGTGATLPTDVTKVGHKFDGWFGNEELTGDAVTDIASDASGDKEYWAKWTKLHAITWMTAGNVTLRTDYVADGEMPSYGQTDPTQESTEQYTFTFEGWSPAVVVATEDASYTAQFKNNTRYYTITWKNYNDTVLETDGDMQYGATVSYGGDTPTKSGDGKHFYAFKGWYPEVTPDTKVAGDQEYVAQFGVALTVGVGENTEYEVYKDEEVVATTVQVAGHLKVPAGTSLTTTDLILEATPCTSGEITGAERVNVTGHAYFDLKGVFKAHTWYAVAVPWQVDVPAYDKTNCGVLISNEGSSFVQQELGRTVDLIYYDGAERAKNGHSNACWRYIEDDNDAIHIMYPGRAYMIYLASDATVIRFKKKADASIHTSSFKVYPYSGNGRGRDANWNGIANPATFQAYINPNASTFGAIVNAAQIYDGDEKSFSVVNLKDYGKLVVGKPVFVQVPEEKTVVANPLSYEDSPSPAPRRVKEHKDMMPLEVSLVANESEKNDRIIIHMSDDKEEDSYIVGKDLMKMGVSDIIPQMWVDRYDSRLCINTVAPVNDVATYPLSLFAPKADEYTISTSATTEDKVTLYLTFDGRPIWNLTYSPYVTSLEKGTTQHYGLMLVRSKAPEVATGMGEVQDGTQPAAQKIMLNGQVYILRGGELYSITGQSIK